jgi:hypothetical protein
MAKKLGPRARGYGAAHDALRKAWKIRVDAGEVHCARCHLIIDPEMAWDLGHPLDDKTLPATPWHATCNRSYGASVTRQRRQRASQPAAPPQKPKRQPGWRSPTGIPWSRDWGAGVWSEE